jgi:hypothetical protein
MQPARIKPHAKEHTNNPVQKPNFRGHAGTMARTRVYKPPTVLQDHQGRENKRASVDLALSLPIATMARTEREFITA